GAQTHVNWQRQLRLAARCQAAEQRQPLLGVCDRFSKLSAVYPCRACHESRVGCCPEIRRIGKVERLLSTDDCRLRRSRFLSQTYKQWLGFAEANLRQPRAVTELGRQPLGALGQLLKPGHLPAFDQGHPELETGV